MGDVLRENGGENQLVALSAPVWHQATGARRYSLLVSAGLTGIDVWCRIALFVRRGCFGFGGTEVA